jgi:Uma2 family endonuclease
MIIPHSSFRGARLREPGIQSGRDTGAEAAWIPGSRKRAPRNDAVRSVTYAVLHSAVRSGYTRGKEVIMNFQPNLRMDKAAFLAWMQANEGRYELAGGRVVMMPGVSRAHGMLVMNIASLLREQLDRNQWTVIAEFGLDAGPQTLRYPDVVVDRAGGGNKDYTATAPALLVEVLSPSTAEIDLGDKAAEYLQLPSLIAYIVLSQDEPKAWVYERASASFAPGPEVVAGVETIIRVAALQLELPLTDIYAGVIRDP